MNILSSRAESLTVLTADEMKVIATLPGRDGLISMLLSCLQAPVRKFACAVQAIADKEN